MNQFVFETALGYFGFIKRERALLALTFGHTTASGARKVLARHSKQLDALLDDHSVTVDMTNTSKELVARLQDFASGEPTDFSDLTIETPGVTNFQRRVIEACRAIPWGETMSYGELARRAGRPGAARAVGTVMSSNRLPLVVPCHRVVAANGGLGGYSAPQGLAMKRRLLAAEKQAAALC